MNKWDELRKWVFHRQDLETQNKMRELEAATHRKIMDGTAGLYWIDTGTLEWAVREAMKQNIIRHDEGTMHRTLESGPFPNMLYLQQHREASFAGHMTLLPKTGWYAEKKPTRSISELW